MKQRLVLSLLFPCCLLALMGCSDDEKDYPSLITDMMMASVNAAGGITTMTLDNGSSYDVHAQGITTDVKDTIVRCLASYTLDQQNMTVYNVSGVLTDKPYLAEDLLHDEEGKQVLESLPRDPMKVVSMWKSGGYINMQLGMLTTGNGTHAYAFCEDSVGAYSLVHQRPADDAESYTQKVYMSMPIPEGVEHLTFSIYTYDGIYTRTF